MVSWAWPFLSSTTALLVVEAAAAGFQVMNQRWPPSSSVLVCHHAASLSSDPQIEKLDRKLSLKWMKKKIYFTALLVYPRIMLPINLNDSTHHVSPNSPQGVPYLEMKTSVLLRSRIFHAKASFRPGWWSSHAMMLNRPLLLHQQLRLLDYHRRRIHQWLLSGRLQWTPTGDGDGVGLGEGDDGGRPSSGW